MPTMRLASFSPFLLIVLAAVIFISNGYGVLARTSLKSRRNHGGSPSKKSVLKLKKPLLSAASGGTKFPKSSKIPPHNSTSAKEIDSDLDSSGGVQIMPEDLVVHNQPLKKGKNKGAKKMNAIDTVGDQLEPVPMPPPSIMSNDIASDDFATTSPAESEDERPTEASLSEPIESPMETNSPTETSIETGEPTSAIIDTEVPTSLSTSIAIPETGIDNDQCTGATLLPFGRVVTGSTINATRNDNMEDCGSAKGGPAVAPGVWYTFTGNGKEMMVYANASLDIQLVVYEGDDCQSLSCLAGTDGLSPAYNMGYVTFSSTEKRNYYVLVSGVGEFNLKVSDVAQLKNDECSGATELTIDELLSASLVFAQTDEVNDYCTDWSLLEKGVWFRVSGTGDLLQASIDKNDFVVQTSIYQGSCGELSCVAGNISSQSLTTNLTIWNSTKGVLYTILVSGNNRQVGNFDLIVSEATVHESHLCSQAEEMPVPSSTNGSTVGATLEQLEYCGNTADRGAPGVWFSVAGTGETVQATVYADFDSQIIVYSGSCQNGVSALSCINGNDEAPWSSGSSEIVWDALEGLPYKILVTGNNGEKGNFKLNIGTAERPTNDNCIGSIDVELGVAVTGTTRLASPDGVARGACGGAAGDELPAPGVFYLVRGTGSTLSATIVSTYDVQLSVFNTSCDNLVCLGGTGGQPPEYTSGNLAFDTINGATYYILIYGYNQEVGDFELTISAMNRPINNTCSGALQVNSGIFIDGTTDLATSEEVAACGSALEGNLTAPGLWYTIEGINGALSVTLEGDYNVQISVYSGRCENLTCVAGRPGVEPLLNIASLIFDSQEGILYRVFVHGLNGETGEFQIRINEVSRPSNDNCSAAEELNVDSVVQGSTAFASSNEVDFCGNANKNSAPGIFYTLQVDSDVTLVAAFHADYDAQLSLFEGPCNQLRCLDGTEGDSPLYTSGTIEWDAISGMTYSLYVHGFNGNVGDFNLTVSHGGVAIRPENNRCKDAIAIRTDGQNVRGSTILSTSDDLVDCGVVLGENTSGGVWYRLLGTGTSLLVSAMASFDSQVSLYTGDCTNLSCIDSNIQSDLLTASSSLLFESTEGMVYFILVSGQSSSTGDFVLTVQVVTVPTNDQCSMAIGLEIGHTVSGSTLLASMDDDLVFAACGGSHGDDSAPGVYYSVVGTGQLLNANLDSNYDMQLTIFSGTCNSLECIDGTEGIAPNFSQGSVIWESQEGTDYLIFVHGFDNRTGNFQLSIDSINRPVNNNCENAFPVPVGLPIGGSTSYATPDNVEDCVSKEVPVLATPGVFYQYSSVSTNDITVIFTNTTYTTQVSVFSGDSCNNLSCAAGQIGFNLTWSPIEKGEHFYLYVNGFDGQRGDFEFVVTQS